MIVAKFGGTSVADPSQIRKVLKIVHSDPRRQHIVVSAPGKRSPTDYKITDLLYEWHAPGTTLGLSRDEARTIVTDRFCTIAADLGVDVNTEGDLNLIAFNIDSGHYPAAYAASRGEYLTAKIVAAALGYAFVDAADCFRFDRRGHYHQTDALLSKAVKGRSTVVPGFYGRKVGGEYATFSRGGSDVTGAIVARALKAELYENWTDVPGLLLAHPAIVSNPIKVDTVAYDELRELAYMGAGVFHETAMFPVQEARIPTCIRNTNQPDEPGTMIVSERRPLEKAIPIVGIAGRRGFTVITVAKALMNEQIGFGRKLLSVLENHGVSYERTPGGIDTVSVVVESAQLVGKLDSIMRSINARCKPDTMEVRDGMSMIAVVGRGMVHNPGVAARILAAVAAAGVNNRMVDQGASEISFFIGVEDKDLEVAVRAIYNAFVS